MTATLPAPAEPTRPAHLWSTMPGWGINANLLPPEILAARRVRVVRKFVLGGLVAVLLLGAAGYIYAYMQRADASDGLVAAQNQTAQLMQQQHKYSEVVQISGDVDQIKGELSSALSTDVDINQLMDNLLVKAPKQGQVTQLGITLQSPAAGAVQSASGAGLLDPSDVQVGTVMITGQTKAMSDVAAFVKGLASVPGVVGVYPSSQQSSGTGVQYTVQLTLTDQVYSHRFDLTSAAPTGGK